MARRLEQLHAALGDAEAAPLPATVIKKQVATDNAGNSFGTGTLIITAMISALLGAGMMWLATSGTPAPVNQTFSVKPLPAPPVATVTPLEATLPSPASTEISDKAKVGDMLENWRNAWASRDVAAYLSAYGQQFAPADGKSRDTWVAARTSKLSAGAPIAIQIRELGIERINADQFKATFQQDYSSGSYREMARTKTLLITRENDEWKIIREWVAENPLTQK